MNKTVYYKYRSLEKFDRVLDILINKRIHASKFNDLNDPMEGYYYHYGFKDELINKIKESKDGKLICSFSAESNIDQQWAYYADSQKGVCIGVKLQEKDAVKVKYDGITTLQNLSKNQDTNIIANEILIHKNEEWKHEQEYRVFTHKKYVKVEIVELIIGNKTSDFHKEILQNLMINIQPNIVIKKFNPYKKSFEKIYPKN